LDNVTAERDKLKQKLSEIRANEPIHKPVPNPLQTSLVNHLVARDAVKSKEVEEVMRSIDRGEFSPKDPYVDRPQQIAFNTTISAPHMHAIQLEILKDCLRGAKKALDIGTGSGFVALSMAKMMKGDDIKVYAIDHIPKLVEQARENIAKSHKEYLDTKKIELMIADGREGLEQHAPFDVIFVGGSVKEIPEVFYEQLAPGGSMVIPVGEYFQNLTVVHKSRSGKIEKEPVMSVVDSLGGFSPLKSSFLTLMKKSTMSERVYLLMLIFTQSITTLFTKIFKKRNLNYFILLCPIFYILFTTINH